MKYLHTMIRTSNLEKTLDFFCNKLGFLEVKKNEYANGKFTLVFLCAPDDFPEDKDPVKHLRFVADKIAGLTDSSAVKLHKQFFPDKELWPNPLFWG